MKAIGDKFKFKYWLNCIFVFYFVSLTSNDIFSQDFIPKLDPGRSIQRDSDNFYFNHIWIKSRDINSDDINGFMRRATDKLDLGLNKEALLDANMAIGIDSTLSQPYSLRGFIMLKSDSLKTALSDFKKAISLNDTNLINYQYYAEVCLRMGNVHEADSIYRMVISIDDKFINGHFGLANVYYFKGEYDKAEDQYKRVLKINPSFSYAYFNIALIHLFNDPEKALRNLNRALDVSPGFAQAYFLKGYLEMMQNKPNQTEKNWNMAIKLDSLNKLYRISMGFLKINREDYVEGFSEIRKLLGDSGLRNYLNDFEKSDKEKIMSDFLIQATIFNDFYDRLRPDERSELIKAMCLFYLMKFDIAESLYQKQIALSSSPGLAWFLRGYNLEYCQQPDLSLDSYIKSSEQIVFPHEVFLRLGIIYILKQNYRSAIKSLNRYIAFEDSSRSAFVSLGNAYLSISDYDSAIVSFNKVLMLDSSYLDVRLSRAFCYRHLQRYNEALKDYDVVINHRLFDIETNCLKAECKYASGDTTGAVEILNNTLWKFRFLSDDGFYLRGSINLWRMQFNSAIFDFNHVLKPDNHQDLYTMRGLAFYCNRQYTEAKKDLTLALSINQNDLTALYTLGMVNLKLNEPGEAYTHLREAESMGHPLARRSRLMYLKDYKPPDKNPGN
jgi:tetratricopeptide (TPR) repeat protein